MFYFAFVDSCASGNAEEVSDMDKGKRPLDRESTPSSSADLGEKKAQPVQWTDEDIYDFSHPKRGRAVIINNEKFHNYSGFGSRPGSGQDAKSLKEMFQKLGFDVAVYPDLEGHRIKSVLEKGVFLHSSESTILL
jgi:hypothetical protein